MLPSVPGLSPVSNTNDSDVGRTGVKGVSPLRDFSIEFPIDKFKCA